MKRVISFMKKETVLVIAWALAILSAFLIHPSREYVDYIDFKSLGILWSLMVVIAGLNHAGVFSDIGRMLLSKVTYVWQLVVLLVLLPFFFSMFITNDVALITFVPFSIYILKISKRENLLIPVVVFQTIAANLGSMLTPIGNPQNLYLYGISDMNMLQFIRLMLPYSLSSLVLLLMGIFLMKGKKEKIHADFEEADRMAAGRKIAVYCGLFLLALLSVAFPDKVSYRLVVLVVLLVCLMMERGILKDVDYALLFTFVGFFIFTGNLGNIGSVQTLMSGLVNHHETAVGVLLSQGISNVPAALFLSGFSDNIGALIVGVNLGGLGTLIASMASLISFKLLARDYNELKGKYFLRFTGANVVFLVALLIVNQVLV